MNFKFKLTSDCVIKSKAHHTRDILKENSDLCLHMHFLIIYNYYFCFLFLSIKQSW